MADGVVAELAAQARARGGWAIDTEFMGEGRYRALLCLIQVAVETDDGGPRVEVLDPLDEDFDPAPLADAARRPRDRDRPARRPPGRRAAAPRLGAPRCATIFDTQVAAGFAGLRAQLGYEALLHELLGVRLRKSASFTRWDARPLSDEQVDYAREDVLHLLQLADALQDRLRDRGRLDWAREECRALEDASDERDLETVFARLPRVNSLEPAQRAVARELVAWREDTAREADRPVPSVLADAALVEIAKRRPPDARAPAPDPRAQRGRRCAAAGARSSTRSSAGASAADPGRRRARRRRTDARGRAADRARRGARARPRVGGASSPTSCSRRAPTCSGSSPRCGPRGDEPDVRTLQGWRRELVGDELLELLAGRRSLRVGPGRTIEVTA